MSAPAVSILTCVYNGAAYLQQALESVLDNGYDDFELIVVDDGSTDETAGIIRRYAERDARIHPLFKENTGLTDSLNAGLEMAVGTYIARLDADDYMLAGRLRTQADYLDRHPEVALVGSDAIMIDEGRKEIGGTALGDLSHEQCAERLQTMEAFFAHSSWMVRRSVMQQLGGYNPFYRKTQDYELLLRLSRIGGIASIGRALIALRKQAGSVSYDSRFLQYKYALTALVSHRLESGEVLPLPKDQQTLFELVERWVDGSGFSHLMLGQRHFSFAWYELSCRHWLDAAAHLLRAAWADPLFLLHRRKQAAMRRNAVALLTAYAISGSELRRD